MKRSIDRVRSNAGASLAALGRTGRLAFERGADFAMVAAGAVAAAGLTGGVLYALKADGRGAAAGFFARGVEAGLSSALPSAVVIYAGVMLAGSVTAFLHFRFSREQGHGKCTGGSE